MRLDTLSWEPAPPLCSRRELVELDFKRESSVAGATVWSCLLSRLLLVPTICGGVFRYCGPELVILGTAGVRDFDASYTDKPVNPVRST